MYEAVGQVEDFAGKVVIATVVISIVITSLVLLI
jgi:hypothetical protein